MPSRPPPRSAPARGGAARTWAENVHADLDARGATVWRDEHGVAQGAYDWYARIRDALERANVVACIVGADSDGSRWQRREMPRADELALPVVAFRTEVIKLPLLTIEKQPVDLRDPQVPAASFETLATALAQAALTKPCRTSPSPPLRTTTQPNANAKLPTFGTLLVLDLSEMAQYCVAPPGHGADANPTCRIRTT